MCPQRYRQRRELNACAAQWQLRHHSECPLDPPADTPWANKPNADLGATCKRFRIAPGHLPAKALLGGHIWRLEGHLAQVLPGLIHLDMPPQAREGGNTDHSEQYARVATARVLDFGSCCSQRHGLATAFCRAQKHMSVRSCGQKLTSRTARIAPSNSHRCALAHRRAALSLERARGRHTDLVTTHAEQARIISADWLGGLASKMTARACCFPSLLRCVSHLTSTLWSETAARVTSTVYAVRQLICRSRRG